MTIVGLDREQGLALIAEMTSARNLLAYGLRVIRADALTENDRDPILTTLSIGVEKLYKLTLGLAVLDREGIWPTTATTKAWGHKLVPMHDAVMSELRTRTSGQSPYIRELVAEVEADPVVRPLIGALDMYGSKGRFYYLDLLGGGLQSGVSPTVAWQEVESAASADAVVSGLHRVAMADVGSNEAWQRFQMTRNERLATALERVWTMIAMCGKNSVLGQPGRTFGFEMHPDSVGRQ